MDELRVQDKDLPTRLYRVQYDRSVTRFRSAEKGTDLEAQDTQTFYTWPERDNFAHAVQKQFHWGHRGKQPFISVFSDKDYAMNWAMYAPWNRRGYSTSECQLLTVDTTKLGKESYVFKLNTLVGQLGVVLRQGIGNHEEGAYLFLHRVPEEAIVQYQDREEIRRGNTASPNTFNTQTNRWTEKYRPLDVSQKPTITSKARKDDDTDNKVEESNATEDAVKMLEDLKI